LRHAWTDRERTLSKNDRKLGMDRPIKRRDFVHGVGVAALGASLPAGLGATASARNTADYPPTKTGLRGSEPGSFEVAHALAREGKRFPPPRDLSETYDLVVIGAGISGLAAAHFYRKRYGEDSRILILENHDDFGGHARRNEFHQGGEMRLSLGGTHNLEHWAFSDTVNAHLEDLGIEIDSLLRAKEFKYGYNSRNGPAMWFDEDTYGVNRLVAGFNRKYGGGSDPARCIDQFPVSAEAKRQLKRLYTRRENVLAGMDEGEAWDHLSGISYTDFLKQYGGLGEEALQLFDNAEHGSWALETRSMSAAECLDEGLPGLNLLGYDSSSEERDYPVAMYPDGNASVARLQVASLIPQVAPGTTADNVALAEFDYGELDQPGSPVRLRLNTTAIHAQNTSDGVQVSYLQQGQPLRVKSRHCVMACYHVIIPHLCPDLPAKQREAMKYQVKRPLLLTNVLIRSSAALDKLGIDRVSCPGRMHADMFMLKGINTGGYLHHYSDGGPVPLVFWGTIAPPKDVVHVKDQHRASRAKMLGLTFEDYEREVRTVCDGLLGPAGFDVKRDILAITVNRWPHGYAYDYLDLWDPEWAPGEAPHEIARRPFGNIVMANSDAGADAYTHVAIDEAFRAVSALS
jgi:spermidine dehydrogenase